MKNTFNQKTVVSQYNDEYRRLNRKRLPTQDELNEYIEYIDEVERSKYFIDDKQEFGQCYENHAVFGIRCPVCGAKEFNVGYHSYLIICRCSKCGTTVHTHDG